MAYFIIKSNKNNSSGKVLAIVLLSFLLVQFIIYTYMPPQIGIFISPVPTWTENFGNQT